MVGRGFDFELWKAGYYTVVHFSGQDLTILWDRKTTVHIRAGPQWKVWAKAGRRRPAKKLVFFKEPTCLCSDDVVDVDVVIMCVRG